MLSILLFTSQRTSALHKENVLSKLDKTCFSGFECNFVLREPSLVFFLLDLHLTRNSLPQTTITAVAVFSFKSIFVEHSRAVKVS